MANLYEIDEKLALAIEWGCDEDGVLLDEAEINKLVASRDEKVESIGLYFKNMLSDAEAYKTEKESFASKEKIARNKAESLKAYLNRALNGQKFKTTKLSVGYRKSEAVSIVDEDSIPADYLKEAKPTIDKAKIKAELKAGKTVIGCELLTKNNIQIK